MKIVEIKTPNCSRCKAIEPEYIKLQEQFKDIEYISYVFTVDPEAKDYMVKYNLKSAPSFILDDEVVKFEDLKEKIESKLKK